MNFTGKIFAFLFPMLLSGSLPDGGVGFPMPLERASARVQTFHFEAPAQIEMPFELVGNLVVVRAEVNGQTGNFIVDTGAEDLVLNRAHFQGVNREDMYVSRGATGTVTDVGGIYLEEFSWEGVQMRGREVQTVNLSHVETTISRKVLGLIGYEVLRHFEVKLDYYRQRIVLYRLNAFGQRVRGEREKAAGLVPLQVEGRVAVLRASAGGKKLRFALDSGASANLLSHRLNARHYGDFTIEKQVRMSGAGKAGWDVLAGKLRGFNLQGRSFRPMKTVVADVQPLEAAFGTHIHGVLGYEFLHQYTVSINFVRGELKFWN